MNFDEKKSEAQNKAYNYAIYLLSLKLRTEGELREKMRMKKYAPDIIAGVINRLADNSYIDDKKYAEVYLENLKKYKNFGFYGIKKKLMEKRLPSVIIENVLADGMSVEEEKIIARRFLAKNKSDDKPRKQTDEVGQHGARQKTAARMKARGFRIDVILAMMN